jgi:hypothetical protein
MRFSWKVIPRNMLLFSVHFSNVTLQSNLLFRRIKYEWNNPELVKKEKEDFLAKSKLQKSKTLIEETANSTKE